MNYNNYNNPYNQYGYNNTYQNNNVMQPQQTYGYQQPNHTIFVLVNDYIDVERYIVGANQTINFYDGKNGYVYSKSADGMGKYNIRAFKLEEIDLRNNNKENIQTNKEYVTRNDLKALQDDFEQKFNDLSSRIEKASKNVYRNNNGKKESD